MAKIEHLQPNVVKEVIDYLKLSCKWYTAFEKVGSFWETTVTETRTQISKIKINPKEK